MQPLMYEFSRYSKKVKINRGKPDEKTVNWTQLQFTFEKVAPSEFFPNGVKVDQLRFRDNIYITLCNDVFCDLDDI